MTVDQHTGIGNYYITHNSQYNWPLN